MGKRHGPTPSQEAIRLHSESYVVDLHVDTLYIQRVYGYDPARRHRPRIPYSPFFNHADLPRMIQGSIDGVGLGIVLFPFFFDVWKVGARWVLGFYLVVDNLLPFLLTSQGGGGVAHGAHIGGFVAGLVAALGLNGWDRLRGRRRLQDLPEPDEQGTAETLVQAQIAGDASRAVRCYFTLPAGERQRAPVTVVADLADQLAAEGQADVALAIYQRALGDHPRGPRRDRLLLGAGLVLLRHKGRPTPAYQYLLDALDADPAPAVAAEARRALAEIAELQKLPFDRQN